jgi:membrane protein DedA with SNARE-associated domain
VSISDYLLATLSVYGVPMLFVALVIGCVGVPLPSSLLLLAAGSFVEQGELNLWLVLVLSAVGSVLGDNIGYAIGRWGGPRLTGRLAKLAGGEAKVKETEEWFRRRGSSGVFLSRWLLTPLGPVVNLVAGTTKYRWRRFFFYDLIGEALWVVLYVLLGKVFSDRVQALYDLLGNLTWAMFSLVVTIVFGILLFRHLRAL